jgi:hypothetical protein
MKKEQKLKLIGYVAVGIVLLNILLFALTVYSWVVFLVILALGYIFVKWGLPKLKEKL